MDKVYVIKSLANEYFNKESTTSMDKNINWFSSIEKATFFDSEEDCYLFMNKNRIYFRDDKTYFYSIMCVVVVF